MSETAFTTTQKRQWQVSDPDVSAWVRANAGSGKTHVLTQRVLRLLLAGTDPDSILCLTFTKAAAAEMSKRIFGRLGEWAVMPQPDLEQALHDLQGTRPDRKALRMARTLFARALDTPGGLKIQTMHAFCESLLHRFPFEANVPGHFDVLDEQRAEALLAEARDTVLAGLGPDGTPVRDALNRLLVRHSDVSLNKALRDVIAKRTLIEDWIGRSVAAGGTGSMEAAFDSLRTALGVEAGDDADSIVNRFFETNRFQLIDGRLDELLAACRANPTSNNLNASEALEKVAAAVTPVERAERIFEFYLKADRDPRKAGSRVTKAVADGIAGFVDCFEADVELCLDLLDRLNSLATVQQTEALLTVGHEILRRYRAAKERLGLLDYDDLIARTRTLLERSEAAAWVLYKLDSRIDHILVDEAQDTSPAQWAIIDALAGDFFAGRTASDTVRTIFAVGDDKQSIYSFQGANPAMLAEMETRFLRLVEQADMEFRRAPLALSFRSTSQVLDAVDAVFKAEVNAEKVTGGVYELHSAHRLEEPGHVIVWPRQVAVQDEPPEDWTEPWDTPTQVEKELAEQIAREIRGLLDAGGTPPSGRPVSAGEILILVRKRDAFFTAINRALRTAGVATAGADRVAVSSHIAVLDCLALADAMLLPEDDLQLAAGLKSPLVGLDDDDLIALAAERSGSLWQSLAESGEPRHQAAFEKLSRWRAMADQVTPFRFFSRVLGPDGGRRALVQRLGGEADDVLDVFLSEALAYERSEPASLQGFAAHIRGLTSDIKREPDERAEDVRVMTVHGAKGLEADIVFLVDTGSRIVSTSQRDPLLKFGDPAAPALLMRQGRAGASRIERTHTEAEENAASDEYARLLYVGMTRARDRLYLCGLKKKQTPDDCWYRMAVDKLVPESAVDEDGELTAPFTWPDMLDGADRSAPAVLQAAGQAEAGATAAGAEPVPGTLPDWLDRPAEPPPHVPEPLRPSRALAEPDAPAEPVLQAAAGAITGPASGLSAPMLRGRAIHTLLQHLSTVPEAQRQALAETWLKQNFPQADTDHAAWIAEALAVIDHPELAGLFGPGSRAEVPVAGYAETQSGRHAVSGQIDRLLITAERAAIVDFKTDRVIPADAGAVEPAYVTQLALYRRLVGVATGRDDVDVALVWTAGPAVMRLPAEMLDRALAAIGVLPSRAA